jgi:hypothetical protein
LAARAVSTEMENYRVYLHVDLETYEVVYVGLGQAGRPWDNLRRGREHRLWMEKQDLWTVVLPVLKSATKRAAWSLRENGPPCLARTVNLLPRSA